MELRHLRYFVAVAEELSLTRAAARLGIAQPPLSQQIAKLERELEVRLLERGPRGVRLTTAGAALLDEAHVVLARTGEATRIVRQVEHGRTGAVRIASVASGFSGVLLDLLPAFRAAYPGVLPLVYELEAVPQLEALSQGTIDIGFLRGSAPCPGVTLWPLRPEPLVAALPEGHELSRTEVVALPALAGEPFVLYPRRRARGIRHDRRRLRQGRIHPRRGVRGQQRPHACRPGGLRARGLPGPGEHEQPPRTGCLLPTGRAGRARRHDVGGRA